MRHILRFVIAAVFLTLVPALAIVSAQAPHPRPARARSIPHPIVKKGPGINKGAVIFVGGYFYDPSFGRRPWWSPEKYLYQYHPAFDGRAVFRMSAMPGNPAVYVDGFYAGVAEDFNGFLDGLPLAGGTHEIVLYLDGYRTIRQWIYFSANTEKEVTEHLSRLNAGETSERPKLAPPLPPPPDGTCLMPRGVSWAPPSDSADGGQGEEPEARPNPKQ